MGGASGAPGVAGNGNGGGQSGATGGSSQKADGQPCSAAAECATGVCGGRCCAAGCTCTLPSSANLLKDPGIDVDVSTWTTSIGTISRALTDAERCPYSGSLAANADGSEQVITQCVRNMPLVGDFNFGARFRYETTGDSPQSPFCGVTFYSGFNCDGDIVSQNETDPPSNMGLWQSASGVLLGVRGANSVALAVYWFPLSGATLYLDMLYLSRTPGGF
jgi:hypothetical protein